MKTSPLRQLLLSACLYPTIKPAWVPLALQLPWKSSQRSLTPIAYHATMRSPLVLSAQLASLVAHATSSILPLLASSFDALHVCTSPAPRASLRTAARAENPGSLVIRQHSCWPLDSEVALVRRSHPRRAPALHRNLPAPALSLRHTPKGTPRTPSSLRALFRSHNPPRTK